MSHRPTSAATCLHGAQLTMFNQISWETLDYAALFPDDGAWKLALVRHKFGENEGKLVQASNYFSDFQDKLEEWSGARLT